MHSFQATSVALLSLLATAYGQTFTSCNPLEKTDCPPNTALGVANYTIDFSQNTMSDKVWNVTARPINYGDDGAEFTIAQQGQSPTVQSNFFIFFGQVEIIMKPAAGQGIVSSMVLQSMDLDEVDWEFIGGNNSYVETNFFSKGNQTDYGNAIWYPIEDPQNTWHNYTLDWSPEKLDWIIDGNVIRTLKYEDANNGLKFPQTPCDVRLGIWAGGDPKQPQGTIDWAGGETNYDDVPFTMAVKSLRVSDASRGTQYVYGDTSGSWQSIKILNETKPIPLDGNNSASSSQTVSQKWNGLPQTTKYIVIGVVCGVVGLAILVFAFCCIRQRRAGKHERLLEDAKYEKMQGEVMAYRADMNRMRNDRKMMTAASVEHFSPVSPMMGNAGAAFHGQASPMMGGGRSPNQMGYGYAGGRGYQKY
ncbi:murein transglycosylase [Cladophialophora yegresii CBS 114405]|uniref:chitinase n=1 Tax=Cladophialophora yegresii CBS 114405 TaxID=1182544 RepID=W9WA86_9EURO|nr:murein transglycosylase [Cladophialophora yegresii CBS 114405]EXJ65037.1 murein transglycosylase [Cladophialophora yegresii CBS 114405]